MSLALIESQSHRAQTSCLNPRRDMVSRVTLRFVSISRREAQIFLHTRVNNTRGTERV